MKKKAFTLIELLVVIAIIALLMTILVPSLTKAKKLARSVVCGSNLKQWGIITFAFASDNNGMPPRSFHWGGSLPIMINDVSYSKTDGQYDDYETGLWVKYGTPWDVLVNYGLSEEIAICPAQRWLRDWNDRSGVSGYNEYNVLQFTPPGIENWGDDNWRRTVTQTYSYVAGMETENINVNKKRPHALKERNPSTRVIAADTVMLIPEGTAFYGVRNVTSTYYVNHTGESVSMVDSQNIVYGDGSVEKNGSSYYSKGLDVEDIRFEDGDWSCRHGGSNWGPWFYWEGTDKWNN